MLLRFEKKHTIKSTITTSSRQKYSSLLSSTHIYHNKKNTKIRRNANIKHYYFKYTPNVNQGLQSIVSEKRTRQLNVGENVIAYPNNKLYRKPGIII